MESEEKIVNSISEDADLVFLTPMDVAEAMGCSIPTARQLFYREDFPALKVGKNLKVLKSAFITWASERRMDWNGIVNSLNMWYNFYILI